LRFGHCFKARRCASPLPAVAEQEPQ
jgi:hypothetical protein